MKPVSRTDDGTTLVVDGGPGQIGFDRASGAVTVSGAPLRLAVACAGAEFRLEETRAELSDPLLARVVQTFTVGEAVRGRLTWDIHRTGNIHVHVRGEALSDVTLTDLRWPAVTAGGPPCARLVEADGAAWAIVGAEGAPLGLMVKKQPWRASWNDVGCYNHRTLGGAALRLAEDRCGASVAVDGAVSLTAGQTLEAAVLLRPLLPSGGDAQLRAEATYSHPDELRYVPEAEFRHQRVWETEDRWLGPPIFDGCPQRPYDQLITRPLGLNVLARKRFTWSNEDFSLWRLTGKDRYWESGVKKAYALLATQNEHGGWWEGIEFYNLPPRHHHMYDTYIGGMFLLEAYDRTGHEVFLAAAARCKEFWLGPPPANGHAEVAPGAWWYRWGGYVNEFGHTDERCVLNTHSGATEFLALYAERSGDEEARAAAENGMAAVRWGLERGIQRGDGQFLYCLSQVDPTLERPGDPPYLRLDLVPQIEDVYTVASSYRLMVANRVLGDDVVAAAIRRALDYWWRGYRAGTVYTYRAYATIAYGLAAGELDLRYALALPEILRDPQHFTSLQRGLSPFVAPYGLPDCVVRVEGPAALHVEPIFLRRRHGELLTALVNVEQPVAGVPIHVSLPTGAGARAAAWIDPGSDDLVHVPGEIEEDAGGIRLTLPDLQEFAVAVLRLELDEPRG